ncbi:MAG: putative methyltransferase [Parcubacteria group bacterium]|nr:putative methyltransferase [Parcubacteria group bacterium]
MKELIRKALQKRGYEIRSLKAPDIEEKFLAIRAKSAPYTMTSRERQYALYQAVEYIESANIPGDIVECGVWKGGSTMLAALTLLSHASTDRSLYLYDTFAGMSAPTDKDVNLHDHAAQSKWEALSHDGVNDWDYASLAEVKEHLASTGYPADKVVFVEGKVEETIPNVLSESIALLRLDTDWYESTKHELQHLFPLLVPGGVLIIDDYGHWKGARQAVDEYLKEKKVRILLQRVDYTGRMGVKI